jgi:hypothetical protein
METIVRIITGVINKKLAAEEATPGQKKKKVKTKDKETPELKFKMPEVEFQQTTQPLAEVEKEKVEEQPAEETQKKLVFGPAPDIKKKPDFLLRPSPKEAPKPEEEAVGFGKAEPTVRPEEQIERYKRNLPSKEFQRGLSPVIDFEEEAPPPFGLMGTQSEEKFTGTLEQIWHRLKEMGVSEETTEAMKKKYEATGEVSFDLISEKIPQPFTGMRGFVVKLEGKTPEEAWQHLERLLKANRVPPRAIKKIKEEFMRSGTIGATSFPFSEQPKKLPKRR